jgi:hypothetical protein
VSLTANLGTFSATLDVRNVLDSGKTVLTELRELYERIRRGR